MGLSHMIHINFREYSPETGSGILFLQELRMQAAFQQIDFG